MGLFGTKENHPTKRPGPPNGDPQATEGWYNVGEMQRWWTGATWQDAYRTDDGRVDASRLIRQAVVYVMDGGSLSDQRAIEKALRRYPPARIVGITAVPGPLAGRLMPLLVIEWD